MQMSDHSSIIVPFSSRTTGTACALVQASTSQHSCGPLVAVARRGRRFTRGSQPAGACCSPAAFPCLLRRRARMVQLQALVLAEDLPLRLHSLLRLAAHARPLLRRRYSNEGLTLPMVGQVPSKPEVGRPSWPAKHALRRLECSARSGCGCSKRAGGLYARVLRDITLHGTSPPYNQILGVAVAKRPATKDQQDHAT